MSAPRAKDFEFGRENYFMTKISRPLFSYFFPPDFTTRSGFLFFFFAQLFLFCCVNLKEEKLKIEIQNLKNVVVVVLKILVIFLFLIPFPCSIVYIRLNIYVHFLKRIFHRARVKGFSVYVIWKRLRGFDVVLCKTPMGLFWGFFGVFSLCDLETA